MTDSSMIETEVERRLVKERANVLYSVAIHDKSNVLNAANAVIGECMEIEYNGRAIAPSQPVIRALFFNAFDESYICADDSAVAFFDAFRAAICARIEIACLEQAMQEAEPCG